MGARSTSMRVSPTTTMRPRSRARSDGELERVGRGRRGAQEHRVEAEPARDGDRTRGSSRGVVARGSRSRRSRATRSTAASSRSMPTTRQPDGGEDARRELADEPEPDHADRTRRCRASAWRTPCSAIAPTVAYAASSNATPVGDRRDEVLRHGEDLGVVRALAAAGDAVAGRDALDALADLEHDPGGRVADRRERLEPVARRRRSRSGPPRRARLSTTFLTRSGRARAFWSRFFSPVSIFVRSVPALISEARFATSSQPGRSAGAGTSTTLTAPSFGRWATCLMDCGGRETRIACYGLMQQR